MKKSLLFALCLGLATITAAAQRNNSQVDPIQPVPTSLYIIRYRRKQDVRKRRKVYYFSPFKFY
jgi:hypothetical protein